MTSKQNSPLHYRICLHTCKTACTAGGRVARDVALPPAAARLHPQKSASLASRSLGCQNGSARSRAGLATGETGTSDSVSRTSAGSAARRKGSGPGAWFREKRYTAACPYFLASSTISSCGAATVNPISCQPSEKPNARHQEPPVLAQSFIKSSSRSLSCARFSACGVSCPRGLKAVSPNRAPCWSASSNVASTQAACGAPGCPTVVLLEAPVGLRYTTSSVAPGGLIQPP
mmetsp:Transcript_128326/g.357209  ORF Transcript_128326/g.357209 Transcript_128326/m.357209 type:complete len:231 (+) Transcript_128326:114-806(+)